MFPELSGTQSKLLNTEWRESQTSTFKTSLEVHAHALCVNPSLHLSLNSFPEWSRRRDCPAGATLARSHFSLPRQAPCKAMSKAMSKHKKIQFWFQLQRSFFQLYHPTLRQKVSIFKTVSKLNTNAYTAETPEPCSAINVLTFPELVWNFNCLI